MNKEENDKNKASENDDMNSPGGTAKETQSEGPCPDIDLKENESVNEKQTLQEAYSDLQNEYDILKEDSEKKIKELKEDLEKSQAELDIVQTEELKELSDFKGWLENAEKKVLKLEKGLEQKNAVIKKLEEKLRKATGKEIADDKITRH